MANRPAIIDDFDRERGIFTPRDRRFLAGVLDEELSENARRQKRHRLRKRMVHALQDLAYLRLMDLDDIGQIAEEFGYPSHDSDLDTVTASFTEEARRRGKIFNGADEVLKLTHELDPNSTLARLESVITEINTVAHYEKTGKYGKFDVEIEWELTEEMSIEELKEQIRSERPGRLPTAHEPGVHQIFDLGDISPVEFQAKNRELAETVEGVIEDVSDDTGVADVRKVIDALAEREGVSVEKAREAYLDAVALGLCYSPAPEKTTLT